MARPRPVDDPLVYEAQTHQVVNVAAVAVVQAAQAARALHHIQTSVHFYEVVSKLQTHLVHAAAVDGPRLVVTRAAAEVVSAAKILRVNAK